jgi:hypothetical protein
MVKVRNALFICFTGAAIMTACTQAPKNVDPRGPTPTTLSTPLKTLLVPKNGDYQGRGKVRRIDIKGPSIELDYDEIPDVVPAGQTEFLVGDVSVLNGLKLGDEVNFTLRYNSGQETITAVSKIK